ncbi:MAG: hypothetical protein ACRCWJ_05980 [Casimicrobium sp.]
MSSERKPQNLIQWAVANKRTTTADVDGHIHAGLRSAPTTKTYKRWYQRTLARLQEERDATTRDYHAAVARGDVTPPPVLSRRERYEQLASGLPELPSVQAARRLLEKMDQLEAESKQDEDQG